MKLQKLDDLLLNLVVVFEARRIKVTGYSSGRGPRDVSQCSIAPDYGYKRRSTNREVLRVYTQPEGMGYFVQVMFYGRSNFGNF